MQAGSTSHSNLLCLSIAANLDPLPGSAKGILFPHFLSGIEGAVLSLSHTLETNQAQTGSAKCGHLALLCALDLAHCPVSVPEILGPHLCPAGFPKCPSPLWMPVNLCYKLQSGLPLPRPTGVPQRWKLHSLCGPLLTSARDSHAAHHCHCHHRHKVCQSIAGQRVQR